MKIYHNQLAQTLNKGFQPLWLIFGDEPWQKNDALEQIKSHAKQQGFDEVIRFSVDDKFNWDILFQEYQSMSLFASLRIIELEFTSVKIGDKGSKALEQLLSMLNPDIQLILYGDKLDAATQKRKWFKSLEKTGCFIPIYDIEGNHLKQWLQKQARQLGLNLHSDVITLMCELFSGNLPALLQELQKLSILFAENPVSYADAQAIVIQQARFNPFHLTDTLLAGNLAKCFVILEQLKQEGTALTQIIWFVHKEITQIHTLLSALADGNDLVAIFKQYKIWDKKKVLYQNALAQITLANCEQALARLAQVDLISKTSSDFDGYILLYDVFISLYHAELSHKFTLNYDYH